MPDKSSSRGFTLVEVVVSLAVLSLILLATVSALRTFANTQTTLDKMMARVDEVRTVSSFLRDILEGAVSGDRQPGGLSWGGTGSSGQAHFKGSTTSLEWKAPVLFGEVYGGTLLLRLAREGGALKLYWQEVPQDLTSVDWAGQSSRVLVDNIENFHVSFRPELNEAWLEGDWEQQGAPALVRLTIKAKGRHWPDLIIPVQR